jgi:hypothetical protein
VEEKFGEEPVNPTSAFAAVVGDENGFPRIAFLRDVAVPSAPKCTEERMSPLAKIERRAVMTPCPG